jgi:hypothetical protein
MKLMLFQPASVLHSQKLNHVVKLPAQSSVEGCAGDGLF